MAVSVKIKNLAPGAYFNAGPVEVVVLEHFTDGRTLLTADTVREMAFSAWCEIRNAEITAAREKAVGA